MAISVCGALVAAQLPALSQFGERDDLDYQDEGFAARELPNRGYVLTHSHAKYSKAWQYWWKARDSSSRAGVSPA